MNGTETEPTDTTETVKRRGVARFFAASKAILLMRIETRLIGLILAGVVVFAGGAFLFDRIEATNDRQRASDVRASAERDYETARTLYDRQVEEHQACLTAAEARVVTRDVLRSQLIAVVQNGADRSIHQAEGLRTAVLAILPESDQAKAAMDNYVLLATDAANEATELAHVSQDAEYPALDLAVEQAKCVEPGPAPINPSGG